jgi:RHS repeat-associated protein
MTPLSETLFFWDGARVAEATTPSQNGWLSGAESLTFAYEEQGGFKPFGQVKTVEDDQGRVDRKFYAIVTDLVGTPAELWDPATNMLAGTTRATLYGQTEWDPRTTQTCPLRFPGQYYDDETGLHYNYHRYYDPKVARYVSPDPLGLSPAPNQHSYPHDPTAWIDPLGLRKCGGNRPPNMSPPGAGRRGAFREAKRDAGIPVSRQPDEILPNIDKRGNPQPGKIYRYNTKDGDIDIRDDARGHVFRDDPSQDRGPHFNTPNGDHYDY